MTAPMRPERLDALRRKGALDRHEAAEVMAEHDAWKAEALRLDAECDAAKEEARQAKASAGRARYDLTLARAEKAERELREMTQDRNEWRAQYYAARGTP